MSTVRPRSLAEARTLVLVPAPGVVVAVVGPADRGRLHPAEERLAAAIPAARMADFAAGRRAAAAALRLLGRTGPVLQGPDGRPLFPRGTRGSISHCDGFGVCAATRGDRDLGVDLEREGRVPGDGLRHVGSPSEIAWTAADPHRTGQRATELFSAKEAVHKARTAPDGARRGFLGVELRPCAGGFVSCRGPLFRVHVRRMAGSDGARYVLALARPEPPGAPGA